MKTNFKEVHGESEGMYARYPEAIGILHLLSSLKRDLFHSRATSHLLEHSFCNSINGNGFVTQALGFYPGLERL